MKINLNDKWTIKTAKELYTYTSGISKGSQFFGTGYPYLTFTEIFHNYFVPDELTSLVQSNDRERENCSIKRGDVFLTRTSETDNELGMSCVALKDYPNATFNGFTKRLRPLTDDVIPEYAGFYFRSPIFRAAVTSMSSIITRASLNEKMLDKLPVCYPSKKAQQKIASILSAYDNLIQNYKKQIEALQTAASELYKEWFVRFRFPGYQTAKFEKGIPEGWKEMSLDEIANVIMGQSPESCYYNDEKKGLPFHQGAGSYGDLYLIDEIYSTEGLRIAEPGSIIFSVRAPVGKLNLTLNKIILGRGVAAINSKSNNNGFLFWSLKSKFSKEDMIGNGSVFASVTKDELLKQKLLIPSTSILNQYDKNASDIEKRIRALYLQITNLTQQRDLLLPRLMSGKLEV